MGSLALLLPKGNDFDRLTTGVKISLTLTSWTAKDNIILTCKELLHSGLDALNIKDLLSQKREIYGIMYRKSESLCCTPEMNIILWVNYIKI